MNIGMGEVLGGLAVLGYLITYWRFGNTLKERGVEEGKQKRTIDQLQKDLDRAHEKIRLLEEVRQRTDITLTNIQNDLKHLLKSVERMEKKLDLHIDGHVEDAR